jgi:hypothetical protein
MEQARDQIRYATSMQQRVAALEATADSPMSQQPQEPDQDRRAAEEITRRSSCSLLRCPVCRLSGL